MNDSVLLLLSAIGLLAAGLVVVGLVVVGLCRLLAVITKAGE